MFNEKTELPSTLKDLPPEAKRAFMKTYDRAVELYSEGERARRTAFAALKYSFEKVGGADPLLIVSAESRIANTGPEAGPHQGHSDTTASDNEDIGP
jgi:hypothetical protein